MSSYIIHLITPLRREEDGQMAIAMVLALPVIFIFFALAMDAGLWYFDHRTAQNQADAAVLAAVQFLPAEDTSLATEAAITWLTKNGSGPEDLCDLDKDGVPDYPEYSDIIPKPDLDGKFDLVRVCVRRESPGVFSQLSGISFVYVSAVAGALIGPARSTDDVMPWALVPDDMTCDTPEMMCKADLDGDPSTEMVECGYFPPAPPDAPPDAPLCPFGLSEDKLWVFKSSDPITPGNFAPISACGLGTVEYKACIEGEKKATEFYEADDLVSVGIQPGNLGKNTHDALTNRYFYEGGNHAAGIYECDVESTPAPLTVGGWPPQGWDPDGHARAEALMIPLAPAVESYYYDPARFCEGRLVAVPVISHFPAGGASEDVTVIGLATFAIAGWDRTAQHGDALGTESAVCGEAVSSGPVDPTVNFECQMVWGYFMINARAPIELLSISDKADPFAPLMTAMVE